MDHVHDTARQHPLADFRLHDLRWPRHVQELRDAAHRQCLGPRHCLSRYCTPRDCRHSGNRQDLRYFVTLANALRRDSALAFRSVAPASRTSSSFLTQPFFLRVSTIRSEGASGGWFWDRQAGASAATLVAYGTVPTIVPETRPKQRVQSQRKPTRSIGEVESGEGFTRKSDVGRGARFRLAKIGRAHV